MAFLKRQGMLFKSIIILKHNATSFVQSKVHLFNFFIAVTRLDINSECDQKCCGAELNWCSSDCKSLHWNKYTHLKTPYLTSKVCNCIWSTTCHETLRALVIYHNIIFCRLKPLWMIWKEQSIRLPAQSRHVSRIFCDKVKNAFICALISRCKAFNLNLCKWNHLWYF